ncbi:MAG TPA: hypothetical protein VD766_03300 [Solirubrobacterales bacterium]|jgi:hypothetical protein|nr:hypothetical protein [Solirubrobacterales bacterium]
MGVTRLIAEGRRLMFPSDRNKPDHKKDLTISGEVITYGTPNGGELAVAYTRLFSRVAWRYRVVAVEVETVRQLGSTTSETWEQAQQRLEAELRDQRLIA